MSIAEFRTWFAKNVPPGTVISDPNWWADRIISRLASDLTAAEQRIAELAELHASALAMHMQEHRRATAAEAVADRLRKDAARYQWLFDSSDENVCIRAKGSNPIHTHLPAYYQCRDKQPIDDYIDAELTGTPVADGGEGGNHG